MAQATQDDPKDDEDKDAKAPEEPFKRADGDDSQDDSFEPADASDDSEDDEEDEDDEDEDEDDESPIGEFRVRVMPDGTFRVALDGDDDSSDDADDSDTSDENDLQRSDDGSDAADKPDPKDDDEDEDKKDKDADMDKSSTAAADKAPSPRQVGVTEESLSKALEAVMQFAKSQDGDQRQTTLLAKAQSSEGLTPAEAKELFTGIGKKAPKKASLADKVHKGFVQDDELQKSQQAASQDADVAGYLESLTERMAKSHGTICDAVEASDHRHYAFAQLLSKAVGQIGTAVKLIGQRMQVIESQPARAPKSLSAQPAQKSFAGEAPAAASALQGPALIDTLTRMNIDSVQQGRKGLSKSHRDIMSGIEKAMSGLPLDAELMNDVQAYRQPGA